MENYETKPMLVNDIYSSPLTTTIIPHSEQSGSLAGEKICPPPVERRSGRVSGQTVAEPEGGAG